MAGEVRSRGGGIWSSNQLVLINAVTGHRWARVSRGDMDHPPLVKLPHRSFWQALSRHDPFATCTFKVYSCVEAYFGGRNNAIGLYVDEDQRNECVNDDDFIFPDRIEIYHEIMIRGDAPMHPE